MSEDIATVQTVELGEGLFARRVVAAPSDDTLQWRAEVLQLVNWGGFSGRVAIDLHGDATMISGASGVGKSTVLDAYTALLMPSDAKFNGASNDAVAGRARGAGQRNLLSYLRGAVDVVDDPRTGRPVETLLRGRSGDTWGAVAMTFVNDRGRRFTALRTYYVPRRATRSGEVQMQLVTVDAPVDLAGLEAALPDRFHATTLKKLYPGARVHRTYAEFAAVLHARLGIGANGDGAKALRLLARIQAGNQVRSVDELYKDMVLERPATYAAADRAIEHFDDLESAYRAMRTEEQKLELLAPIPALHERRVAAVARAGELDAFGVTAGGDTPVRLWLLRTHARLLGTAVETNRRGRAEVAEELRTNTREVGSLAADLETAKEQHRSSGGATLERLGADIDHERVRREERSARRDALRTRLATLDEDGAATALSTRESFDALVDRAEAWLAEHAERSDELVARRDAVMGERYPLLARRTALGAERSSLDGRAGRVPEHLHAMRAEVARVSGLSPAQLPFVAELLDVAPEEGRWRLAVETVLAGTARLMLVPLEHLEHFSRAIDSVRLRGRLAFEGAELDLAGPAAADRHHVAGKLLFQDSPFRGWVQRHVAEPSRNARCVESADELAGTAPGAACGSRPPARPGPAAAARTGAATSAASSASATPTPRRDRPGGGRRRGGAGGARRAAPGRGVRDPSAGGAAGGVRRRAHSHLGRRRRGDLRGPGRRPGAPPRRDPRRRRPARRAGAADGGARVAARRGTSAGFGLESVAPASTPSTATWSSPRTRSTTSSSGSSGPGASRSPRSRRPRLDDEFAAAAAPADPEDLARFPESSGRLPGAAERRGRRRPGRGRAGRPRAGGIFRAYQFQWEDPNLGAGAESYPDFARILADIEATGLAQRRAEWRRRLTEWSGQDLVPLAGAMSASVEEIEDRLEPINAILRRLEFGAEKDRLRIRLRRLAPAHVQVFMRDLRELSRGTDASWTRRRWRRGSPELRPFMGQLRRADHVLDARPPTATACSTYAGTWRSAPSATTGSPASCGRRTGRWGRRAAARARSWSPSSSAPPCASASATRCARVRASPRSSSTRGS